MQYADVRHRCKLYHPVSHVISIASPLTKIQGIFFNSKSSDNSFNTIHHDITFAESRSFNHFISDDITYLLKLFVFKKLNNLFVMFFFSIIIFIEHFSISCLLKYHNKRDILKTVGQEIHRCVNNIFHSLE
jgi:hypothetical protein